MELENKGEILACDIVNRKLEELMRRARRAGVHNVRTHCLPSDPDAFVRAHAGRYARVLVDAPCSGSGTLRRNPDLRNRPLDLTALTALQRQILETASALVAPGAADLRDLQRDGRREPRGRHGFPSRSPGFRPSPGAGADDAAEPDLARVHVP